MNRDIRERFHRCDFLRELAALRVSEFRADFADLTIGIDVEDGCKPNIKIEGLRLEPDELVKVAETLAHLADTLAKFAARLRAGAPEAEQDPNDDQDDDDQAADPAPPPPIPPAAPKRKGRPPGSRNKPKAEAPPPAPPEPDAGPGSDWHGPATVEEPPPESTPVHDEPQAALAFRNPIPVPPDLAPLPDPAALDVRPLLLALEAEGGSGDPRGFAYGPPELVGAAVARKLVRPLGGAEGLPVLLRLTDQGWAELEKGGA